MRFQMASKMVSLRLEEELLAWATEYAAKRGVSRTELLESAVAAFREDCAAGVPEVRELAQRQATVRAAALDALQGVGDCPKRPGELGHIWRSTSDDPERSCRFCGTPGRANNDPSLPVEEQRGFFARATAERSELFSRLKTPDSVKGGGKPKGRAA